MMFLRFRGIVWLCCHEGISCTPQREGNPRKMAWVALVFVLVRKLRDDDFHGFEGYNVLLDVTCWLVNFYDLVCPTCFPSEHPTFNGRQDFRFPFAHYKATRRLKKLEINLTHQLR